MESSIEREDIFLFCFVLVFFPGSERIELEEKKKSLKTHERGVFVCLFYVLCKR